MGIPAIWENRKDDSGIRTQMIEPEYEEYWRKFNDNKGNWEQDISIDEAVKKIDRNIKKIKNKDKEAKVIKLRGKGKNMYKIS